MTLTAGELCAGYGGLALAVEEVFGARPAWFSECDPAPSRILAHHWPDVPNLGDMTLIDWAAVEPVDVVGGGTPCQDLSGSGARKGMTEGTRSNLWVQMREAIATIRPRYVVWENVRGAYSANADSGLESCPGCVGEARYGEHFLRALGRVLGDLSSLGYDCQWRGLRAADVGAPHGRFRVFILATLRAVNDTGSKRRGEAVKQDGRRPAAHDGASVPNESNRVPDGAGSNRDERHQLIDWREYAPAIARWEIVTGRPVPHPVEPVAPHGRLMLSARFTEWLMGLPDGWTSNVPGVSRQDAVKACGNGVVIQQAVAALRDMLAAAAPTGAEAVNP